MFGGLNPLRDQAMVDDMYGYYHCCFLRGDKGPFGMDVAA